MSSARSVRLILVLVIVLGTAVRLVFAFVMGNDLRGLPGIEDQISYDTLGQSLVSGNGWSFPRIWWPSTPAHVQTSHWSFGYTAYLAAVYVAAGHEPVLARLFQALLAGTLMPLLAYRLGCRLLGTRVGLLSAVLIACYGYFIYYAGALMTETFYIIAILWALDQAVLIGQRQEDRSHFAGARLLSLVATTGPWLVLGLALGVAALLRQVVLLFVPVLYAWLVWARWRRVQADTSQPTATSGLASTIVGLLATTAVLGLIIGPWTLHNYLVFGRFVLLNTNAGFAFFWANHPVHGTNFQAILPNSQYQQLIPTELRGLDEAALDSALMSRGLQFVRDDPLRFAVLSVSRLKDYFMFWPSTGSGLVSNLGRTLSFGLYLPIMLYGVLLASTLRRQRAGIVLVYLFICVYTLIHLSSWALIRYRLPVDAVLMPFAALGLLDIITRFGSMRAAGRPTQRMVLANANLAPESTRGVLMATPAPDERR